MKKIPQNPGLVPSPLDPRDILTSQIIPEIKRYPSECPCPFDLKILNQNGYPACVGFSCASIKSFLEMKEKNYVVFDGLWIYRKCKEMDGIPNVKGTFLRMGLKILQKLGAKPVNGKEDKAKLYKITSYAKIDNITFENLKKHIFVYGIILAGFTGSNEGWRNAYVRPPKPNEKRWGHAVCLTSYTKDYLIGLNSWGENWGDEGFFYVPQDYLPFEAWVVQVDYSTPENSPDYQEGWVALPYLNLVKANNIGSTITNLNLRDAPNGKLLTTLPKGSLVKLNGETITKGQYTWVKVEKI